MRPIYKFLFVSVLIPDFVYSKVFPKIGIIGGGIGGTSCAYFLKELFQNKASVTVFEKDTVGGRLRVMNVDGLEYESGGSIIHPRNQYMVEFSRNLDLGLHQPQSSRLGIYNGEKFVFKENDWYIVTMADFLWNYGISMYYLSKDVKSMLDDFSRIYKMQEKGFSYTTVDLLLDAMNPLFKHMSQETIAEILQKKGYSGKFVDELVQSIMMVNYGQTNNISGFAGYVSLAGAENNLWSVEGGNKLIPEGLLKKSEAHFVHANVLEVQLLPENTFSVKYQEPSDDLVHSKNFDIVVLASPLIKSNNNIKFVNFTTDFHQFEHIYHQTVTTFVKGTLNPLAFNQYSLPDEILTNNSSLVFNSIGRVSPVGISESKRNKGIYKIFSQKPLNQDSIKDLFLDVDSIKEKVWLAYPHYQPPEKFVPFVLHPGLYYINAIELSASAMEMSSIAAKNVALLISNQWNDTVDKIDPHRIVSKDEL